MKEFDKLVDIYRKLRSPDGCDWDKSQTIESVRNSVLEEAYEVVDAIDREDPDDLKEELGDLLAQIVFISQMAEEQRLFSIKDVVEGISDKLVRRHPHVFGNRKVSGVDEILKNWEEIKDAEKKNLKKGTFGSVPKSLPSLMKAYKVLKKSKRKGLWNETKDEVVSAMKKIVCDGEMNSDSIPRILWNVVKLAVILSVDVEAELSRIVERFVSLVEDA